MPQAAQTSVMVISVTGFASMASTTAFWMAFLVAAASATGTPFIELLTPEV